jgi:hypothetical protein
VLTVKPLAAAEAGLPLHGIQQQPNQQSSMLRGQWPSQGLLPGNRMAQWSIQQVGLLDVQHTAFSGDSMVLV